MREILFRGRRTDNGDWVYGCYVKAQKHDNSGYEHFIIEIQEDGSTYEVIPETVGQYTGLTDKNGKKIFENDIVKEPDIMHKGEKQIAGKTMMVEIKSGCWFATDGESCAILGNICKYWEIIGNTADNPELIGGVGDG